MKQYTVAAIGEILWDVLPEAEVLGGAPVNFAYHVTALGAKGVPISTIGQDPRGVKALAELRKRGVETSGISIVDGQTTGYVTVSIDAKGVASYLFPAETAWDHLQINSFARDILGRLDAVCFGSLAQRTEQSRRTILGFLDGLARKTVRVYDINLRQNFYSREIIQASLERADILKLNDEELPILVKLFGFSVKDSLEKLKEIVGRYNLDLAILTRGGDGSLLVTPKEFSDYPGNTTRIVDTIGAGDAFTAAVTLGYLERMPLDSINEKANRLAAYVCSQRGAMPEIPEEVKINGR